MVRNPAECSECNWNVVIRRLAARQTRPLQVSRTTKSSVGLIARLPFAVTWVPPSEFGLSAAIRPAHFLAIFQECFMLL
jgi:hypothetical protein